MITTMRKMFARISAVFAALERFPAKGSVATNCSSRPGRWKLCSDSGVSIRQTGARR